MPNCVWRGRRDRLGVVALLLAVAGLAAAHARAAEPEPYENPPLLHAADVAPAALLAGPGFAVADAAPSDGFLARFTVRSDWGVFEAYGVATLAVRVAEVVAIRELERLGASEGFGKAVAAAAGFPIGVAEAIALSVGQAPLAPSSTLLRFFGAASAASEAPPRSADADAKADRHVRDLEKRRREIAARLRVDPYTGNPVLARWLGGLAWASSAQTLVQELVSSLSPTRAGEAVAIPGGSAAHELVYETPLADLIAENRRRMAGLGATEAQALALLAASAFSVSAQTALVESLGRLDEAQGRARAIELAASLQSTDEALYLTRAARILADRNEQADVVEVMTTPGLAARLETGVLVVPVPVDLLSWTEPVARFATSPALASPERALWISGRASSRARIELEALGWEVHEGVKL